MAMSVMPDRPAVKDGTRRWTYAELDDLSSRAACLLTGHATVVHVGVNGPVLPLLLFATAKAGVPLAVLNYRLSGDQLVARLAELANPLVVTDERYLTTLAGAAPTVLVTELIDRAATADRLVPRDLDERAAAVILFTSGTTSTPKGVVLRHDNLVSYVLDTVAFAGARDGDTALIATPPYHVAGVAAALTNVYSGRAMAYLADFSPSVWLDAVRANQVTHAMVVPTMLARIVEHLGGASADVPSLRSLAYGGARMPRPVLERVLAAFPGVDFVNAYGLTETSSTIAVLGPDDHRAAVTSTDPAVRDRLSSVGRLVPGVEAQVRDPAGLVLPVGETGLLWVRGPQVSGEYLHGSALDPQGWFPTADRARLDTDGYLFMEGRADDTIIRGGENIAPAEIEDALLAHPGVRQAAVVGLPDDEWGERIAAAVVADDPTVTAAVLRAWCRERLRGSRTPDEVFLVPELPHTETGKLIRRSVVSLITEVRA
ncbi:class I adenylate-forming enzyme family protein [Dactylosporangium sp. CA-092794]|uniref:class I adenylate-forming enzyme family protein n=1 Tax=Dactylosporangium sp. CA-092794 TaxID=3239929 RepID=UPI003D8B5A1B